MNRDTGKPMREDTYAEVIDFAELNRFESCPLKAEIQEADAGADRANRERMKDGRRHG